jgi:hypothetical protein
MSHQTDQAANADEGADPSKDIKKQNPGETTTDDLAKNREPEPSPKQAE